MRRRVTAGEVRMLRNYALETNEVEAGYVAMHGEEGRNDPVDDLPPDATVVILTMPMGGG